MIIYEDVDLFKVLHELQEVFPEHYEELNVVDLDLDPDYDAYRRLNEAGMLRCITCRHYDQIIGWIVFVISPHIHYKNCKTAIEDVYFLRKKYRKGRIGIKLFQYAEQVLKCCGVNRIIVSTKVNFDNSRLFEYLGYTHTDKKFTKMLGN